MAGLDLSLSGLASGFDWKTLVDQLAQVERAPQQRLRVEQNQLAQRLNAYGSIKTELGVLQSRVDALKAAALFDTRTAQSSDSSAGTAQAGEGAAPGTYDFSFQQLATAAKQNGTANVGRALNTTNNVSALVLANAGFATAITTGTFTVNGQQVAIATTDTLQQVFDKISTATSGAVTGSYNSATDKITLSSASPIILGSATDTSNFLVAAHLSNNGTGTVASNTALGSIRVGATLASANFATTVSDGGSGAGEFKINGVSITFNAGTDTVNDVLKRINDSNAGVMASYDSLNDRFVLANETTGDLGVALQDVTGNFLATTGLAGGTLARGQDLIYTINGGGQLTSHSNTIASDSHGITGLTVNALKGAESTTATSGGSNEIGFPTYVSSIGGSGATTRLRTAAPHGLETGYAVKFESTGSLPSQLVAGQTYYVRRTNTTDLKIYNTAADAAADTNSLNFGTNPSFTGDVYMTRLDPTLTATTSTTQGPPATTTITVANDTSKIKTAITGFIEAYNRVQSVIDTQTASTTDAKGVVTAGVLASDGDAENIATTLRRAVYSQVSGLTGVLGHLAELGITTSGDNNNLTLSNESALDDALTSKLESVKQLFTDSTSGIAVNLAAYLDRTIGDTGSLVTKQDGLTKQSSAIDTQVADLEKIVQANRARMVEQFTAMETAQQRLNQQLQFLAQQKFGS